MQPYLTDVVTGILARCVESGMKPHDAKRLIFNELAENFPETLIEWMAESPWAQSMAKEIDFITPDFAKKEENKVTPWADPLESQIHAFKHPHNYIADKIEIILKRLWS